MPPPAQAANQVERIEFQLSEDNPARARVLREAATRARAEAQELAAALNTRVLRVLSAVEAHAAPPQPMPGMMMARAEPSATPIQPGAIPLSATITLTVEISSAR